MIAKKTSKEVIVDIILETIDFLKINPNKNELADHLLSTSLIDNKTYDLLTNHKVDVCHAIVKKNNRCSNPATKNHKYCNFHINNPPDLTIEDIQKFEKITEVINKR